MSTTEETLNTIHARLQELSIEATPEQLAYLAKAFETIASSGKMIDIVHLTDQKLDEILAKTNEYLADLEADKTTYVGVLESSKNEAVSEIFGATTQNVAVINNLVNTRKPELEGLVEQFEEVNDVPAGSSILAEIVKEGEQRRFIHPDSLPFVFGIMSRYNDSSNGTGYFTTNLGTWATGVANADDILQLLAGCHEYTTEYAAFYKEPSLCFLQGQKGNFIQKEMYLKYTSSSSQYSYPYAALGVFFIKNTTESNISTSLNFGGSSYSGSGAGASVLVGKPNHAEETVTWTNVHSYTESSSSFSNTASITVPANTTIAVILYTSSHYQTNTSGYYAQFIHWYVHSVRSATLVSGLEIDIDKTIKAWQSRGLSATYDLWR
jgi:hypothetical protein